jgi:hypothetical protein
MGLMTVRASILRLKSGSLLDLTPSAPGPLSISSESPEILEKRTILIHAGSFQSVDGPIAFDADRIKRIVAHQNTAIQSLARGYGSIEQMPLGAFPPILEDHDEETSKVVGRLSGLLEYVEMNIPGVGSQVPAAVGKIIFLGRENTKRVLDGRIYHVSIGINEETDTLSEASVVVTPAAPGAMLLSRANSIHLSSSSKTKKGKDPMPPSSAQKNPSNEERNKRLHSLRHQMQKLTTQIHTGREIMHLKAKEAKLIHRLKSAVSGGKMTPAEYRKLLKDGDFSRLAGLPDEASDLFIKAYESRESVIEPGQRGTLQALEGGQVAKEIGQKRLKAEIKADIVAGGNTKRLKKLEGEPSSDEDIAQHRAKRFSELTDDKRPRSDQESEYPSKNGLEAVDGEPPYEDYQKKMSEMEEHIAQLQTVCAKLVDEMNLMASEESDEDHDLAGSEKNKGIEGDPKDQPSPKPNSEENPTPPESSPSKDPAQEKEPEKKE